MAKKQSIERIQDVKLKNGKEMNYFKSDGKHLFFSKLVAISNWQLYILLFILVFSILMSFFEVMFITEGFNRILQEIGNLQAQTMGEKLYPSILY